MNDIKVPKGWKRVKLGDIIIENKKSKFKVEDADNSGYYPFFTSGESILTHSQYIIDGENIFLATGGIANIKYYNGKASYSTDTYSLKSKIPTKYLYYYLLKNIKNIDYKYFSGSGLKHLQKDEFKKEEIIFPKSKEEQQKIAEILEKIDNVIEKTDKIINKYKKIKEGLMQDLLTKGIDENGNIRDEKTHKFKDSPLGRIPEEWEVVELRKIGFLKGRIGWQGLTTYEYLDEGEYYLVSGINFKGGKIDWQDCFYVDKRRYNMDKNIQLRIGDILITKDGTIGKVAYINNLPKKATLNSGVFVLRPINDAYHPKYIYYILTSFIFNKFIDNLKAGSTISHLYQKDFVLFNLPLPPLQEQQRIAKILTQIDNTIEKEQKYKEKLIKIKNGLMEDLLTGKIRVNNLIKNIDNINQKVGV